MDFVSTILAEKCEIYHESTRCINTLFYTNKHDKVKNNNVTLEINNFITFNADFISLMDKVSKVTK